MFELIWAWRLLFSQISPEDVPEPLREAAVRWRKELSGNDG